MLMGLVLVMKRSVNANAVLAESKRHFNSFILATRCT